MPKVYQRTAARRDLVEHFAYLGEQPNMGAPLTLKPPELAGLRKWRVKEFDNYLGTVHK